MHTGLAYWISNLIMTILWMIFANIILENRYPRILTVILEVIIHYAWWVISENYLNVFSSLRLFSGILALFLILYFFHTDSLLFKFAVTCLLFISDFIANFLVAMMLPWDAVQSGTIFEEHGFSVYTLFIFTSIVLLTIICLFLMSYKKKYLNILSNKQKLLFIVFPVSQLASISVLQKALGAKDSFLSPGHTLLIVLLYIAADICLFLLIRATADNTELKVRNELLEEQISAEESFYSDISSAFEDIRKMRHDIDNHLYTMRALLEDGKMKQASDYADKVTLQNKTETDFNDCHNMVLASYLSKKAADIKNKGITLQSDIHVPAKLSISNPDLICVYGNILDNAIEACESKKDPLISLSTYYKEPYLMIDCLNPANDEQNKKKRIPELERGIGLHILKDIAERYDGEFTSKITDDHYQTKVILKNTCKTLNKEQA